VFLEFVPLKYQKHVGYKLHTHFPCRDLSLKCHFYVEMMVRTQRVLKKWLQMKCSQLMPLPTVERRGRRVRKKGGGEEKRRLVAKEG
jgi:hypothetical protein